MYQCAEFGERLHGIIIVVKANDPRLSEGALKDYLKPVRDILRKNGIAPITVVTYRNKLDTEEECKEVLYEASAATGSSPGLTFFVSPYSKHKQQRDPDIERMVIDIMHYALMTAERAVKTMKQKEKNRQEVEMMRAPEGVSISGQVAPDSADVSVEIFPRFLQKEYQWSTINAKTASSQLANDDITSVKLLAMCWKTAQERFPIGMKKMIEKELRKRGMIP
ncbi:hypothetical protein OS493_031783 [Desmophyllum pertusum]|uniref:Uncharacterized protein n=1 Tax=Desmophyllum pertusum TaxID=174260 RepID=A0A9X0CWG5_9CNID|nr:hypothetical protein OS493_031783 [Desmophyllum pertusum]